MSPRLVAMLQAVFVTVIWSASWVLIKIGLEGIPPVTFAGLRYMLAFLCLLLIVLRSPAIRAQISGLTRQQWRNLIALGIVYYAIAQGAQFAALMFLPAVMLSLILNFTPIAVAFFGFIALNERPTMQQIVGIAVFMVGVMLYFSVQGIPEAQFIGIVIAVVCMLNNSIGGVMSRAINKQKTLLPLTVTLISMGAGAPLMLAFGLATEGIPVLEINHWLIILWLAVVHTALTFVLWNDALRHLTAVEASLINSLMLVFIAVLAWGILREPLTVPHVIALAIAAIGIILVQVRLRLPIRRVA